MFNYIRNIHMHALIKYLINGCVYCCKKKVVVFNLSSNHLKESCGFSLNMGTVYRFASTSKQACFIFHLGLSNHTDYTDIVCMNIYVFFVNGSTKKK